MLSGFKVPSFRTLVVCAVAVACVAALARGFAAWTLRAYSIDAASRDVEHVAVALAAEAAQSVKALDRSLALLQQQLIDRNAATDQYHIAAVGARPAFDEEQLPPGADFAIIDAQGHVVEHSKSWPDANRDVSDREFFAAQRTGRGIYIGLAKTLPDLNAKLLSVSRRAESRKGESSASQLFA